MTKKKKKPYYPNNWRSYKDAPDEFFIPIPYDEFLDWKLQGWELPSSVSMIIREQNLKTGKVKEYVYERLGNANKRCQKIMSEGISEFVVCTHDDLAHMFPKNLTQEDTVYGSENQIQPDIWLDDRFGDIEEDG